MKKSTFSLMILFAGAMFATSGCSAMGWLFSSPTSKLNDAIRKKTEAIRKSKSIKENYTLYKTKKNEQKMLNAIDEFCDAYRKEEKEFKAFVKHLENNPDSFLKGESKLEAKKDTMSDPLLLEKSKSIRQSFKKCIKNSQFDNYKESLCKSAYILFSSQYLKGGSPYINSLNQWILDADRCNSDWTKEKEDSDWIEAEEGQGGIRIEKDQDGTTITRSGIRIRKNGEGIKVSVSESHSE